MSNPNYGRQEKSSGYNHANSIPVEVVAVEAYSVDSYYPPNPPASVDVPSFRDGTYQTNAISNHSDAIRDYLSRSSWPNGLQKVFITGLLTIPTRYFICDDSGSMISGDGHRVVGESATARCYLKNAWNALSNLPYAEKLELRESDWSAVLAGPRWRRVYVST